MSSQLINISRQRTIHTQGQLLSTLTIGQRVAMSSQLINLYRQRTIHTQGQLVPTLTLGQRVAMPIVNVDSS